MVREVADSMGGERELKEIDVLLWEIGDVCMLNMWNIRGMEQSNIHFEICLNSACLSRYMEAGGVMKLSYLRTFMPGANALG